MNGAAPGATGYGQLNVTGAVDLGGSTLSPSLGFTPATGEMFTIIQSTAPIVGTFNGLPEGAPLTIGGVSFHISYAGDNVVLTAAAVAPTVTGISPTSGPASGGSLVTITGTGFSGVTAVDFGPTGATGVTVVN